MHDMTWGEFKAMVEASGVPDTASIEYFDFSFPTVKPDGTTIVEVFYSAERNTFTVH